MTYHEPTTADLLPLDEAQRLGVTANATDQYDLMRAISRCDELVSQLRAVQIVHTQNMCRVANHLAGALGVYQDDGGPLPWEGIPWADRCTTEDPCPTRQIQGGQSCGH